MAIIRSMPDNAFSEADVSLGVSMYVRGLTILLSGAPLRAIQKLCVDDVKVSFCKLQDGGT